MPLSYFALSISFCFLCLGIDAMFKKEHDLCSRFISVSLVANMISMFSFVFPTPTVTAEPAPAVVAADTHRGGNGISAHRVGNGITDTAHKLEETAKRVEAHVDTMNDTADRIILNLAEIKVMLTCPEASPLFPWLDTEQNNSSTTPLDQSFLPDAGVSPSEGAGVSSETPSDD